MAMEAQVKLGHPILFGSLLFFALLEGIVTAWLVQHYNANDSYPSGSIRDRVRFLLFVAWWTVVFTAFYIAAFFTMSSNIVASIASHGAWLALTWFFWLCAIASFTSSLGGGQVCSHSDLVYCSQLVAAEAFGWIEWILISVTFIFIILLGASAMKRGDGLSGGLV